MYLKSAIFISNYKTCISSDLLDFRDCITVRSICDLLYFIPGDFKIHHFNSISKTIRLELHYFMQAAAGAIVEEMVCRGLLMGYIEKKQTFE